MTVLAIAPTNRSVTYVAAPDGVFRTRDAGATWSDVTGPIMAPAGLVVSGANADSLVIAAANGVYRSDDGGAAWEHVGAGLPSAIHPGSLVADPRESDILYLASTDCYPRDGAGIYKSVDGGRTFVAAINGIDSFKRCISALIIDPLVPDRLYSSWAYQDISGILRSDDGAQNWKDAPAGLSPERGVIVGSNSSPSRYAIGDSGFSLLMSADGTTWTRTQIAGGIEDGPVLSTHFNTLALDPVVGRLFLGASNGTYRSGNGGITWLRLEGAARDPINAIDFDHSGGAVVIGTDFGLFRSSGYPWNDWSDLQVGNSAMGIGQVVADPSNGDVYAQSGRHLFVSHDLGKSWAVTGDPLPNPYSSIVIDAGHQPYSSDFRNGAHHIQKLSPEGHWEEIRTIGTFSSLVADPREAGKLYSCELNTLSLTRDGGVTWEPLPLPSSAASLSIDPRDTNVMIVTTFQGLLKSVDGGHTWSLINAPQYWARFWIVRAPSNPDVLYMYARDATFEFVLTRSTDGGQSWSTLPRQPAGTDQIGTVAIDPRDANTIYAATFNHGLVRSTDGGQSWQSIDDGLPENHAASLVFDSKGAFLHGGTTNRGVWELQLASRRRAAGK